VLLASTNIVLNWTGSYTLQSAANAAGPYLDITGANNPPCMYPIHPGSEFFRLRNWAVSLAAKEAPILRGTAMEGRQKAQKIFNHSLSRRLAASKQSEDGSPQRGTKLEAGRRMEAKAGHSRSDQGA